MRYSALYPSPCSSLAASGLSGLISSVAHISVNAGWSCGIPAVSAFMKPSKVSPAHSFMGLLSAPRGPQVRISGTFSSIITRGRTFSAQRIVTHAKPRMFLSTGFPPFALLK